MTVTIAVPAARFVLTSDPVGADVTDDKVVPLGKVSVILAGPANTTIAVLQEPAATLTGVPAILKLKIVPTATPVPAAGQNRALVYDAKRDVLLLVAGSNTGQAVVHTVRFTGQ